jgi:hypothetical protein
MVHDGQSKRRLRGFCSLPVIACGPQAAPAAVQDKQPARPAAAKFNIARAAVRDRSRHGLHQEGAGGAAGHLRDDVGENVSRLEATSGPEADCDGTIEMSQFWSFGHNLDRSAA